MKAIIPDLDMDSGTPLYMQLYTYIKDLILSEVVTKGEKLPSLRVLSQNLKVSISTVELAYAQLVVEGYLESRPHSGYYVREIKRGAGHESQGALREDGTGVSGGRREDDDEKTGVSSIGDMEDGERETADIPRGPDGEPGAGSPSDTDTSGIYDINSFDFVKWKKSINKVLNLYPHLLLSESDPRGEKLLRDEISRYLYAARGVDCRPDRIVIAAGTQQITNHISNILKIMDIRNVSVEDPGYVPVTNIFRDRGFAISKTRVLEDGIDIDRLPTNIKSAVYVSPSNQFPTGAVMPAGNRYRLLEWAKKNESYIIEDDYDSELRYFGRPLPPLKALDTHDSVIYLGSFSSTLFSSVKISYMVLPLEISKVFNRICNDYAQTCSKTEQLALAFFMEEGKYQTGIKKLRRLCANKLAIAADTFEKNAKGFIRPLNVSSGINIIISVRSRKSEEELIREARTLGLAVSSTGAGAGAGEEKMLVFYYNSIPIEEMREKVGELINVWSSDR